MQNPWFGIGNGSRRTLLRWSGWYFLFNWALVLAISTRYLSHFEAPEEWLALSFTPVAFAGHFASIAFLPLLLVVPLALMWPRRAAVMPVAIALGWFTAALIFADTAVFAQYRFHINGMVWGLLFGGAATEIFSFTPLMWMLIAGIAGVLLLAQFGMAWGASWWAGRERFTGAGVWIGGLLFGALLVENGMYAWANFTEYTPITRQARYLPGYQPTNVRGVLAALGVAGTTGSRDFVPGAGTGLRYPVAPMRCEATAPLPNIVVIAIDSWRFDAMTPEITPNISRFARDAWRFEQHYSGGNETRAGVFSLFYGVPATYWHEMMQERRGPVLMSEIVRHGYTPLIYASSNLTSPEFDRTVFADVRNLRVSSKGKAPWKRDATSTAEFIAHLRKVGRSGAPFFGFLFYDTPHGGMQIPRKAPTPFTPYWTEVNYLTLGQKKHSDREQFFNRYKNAVHYVDSLAGKVLDALREEGVLDRTIVIVTGDHAEEFNDLGKGYWGHSGNFSRWQTQVPMVVRWPGEAPRAFSHRSAHMDLAPTLLTRVFGCGNAPAEYSTGRMLTDESGRDFFLIAAYERFAVVTEDRISEYLFAGPVQSYDPEYGPPPARKADPNVMRQALEEVGRFYRR